MTALTGSAATQIRGETTQGEFHLMKKGYTATQADLNAFQDTRLCIVDEISFADHDAVLARLGEYLKQFTEDFTKTFGNVAIAFLGDFCQLESVGGNSIYAHPNSIYWEQSLTAMVELKGTHRYSGCETLTRIMPELRNHGMTEEMRAIFNSRVIDDKKVKLPNIATTQFATYHNRNRCEFNASVFLSYLKECHADCDENSIPTSAIVIKATPSWSKTRKKLSYSQRKTIFEECCDADVENGHSKHCDPMLTLFSGCRLMGTHNSDVKNGVANGTTSTFKRVVFKQGKRPHKMKLHGHWIYAIDSEDVDHLLLEWHDSIYRGKFKVSPLTRAFTVKFPVVEDGRKMTVKTSISFHHFPLLINHATTGHKLQGKSLDALIIAEWSRVKNWAYVVLSRVRTLGGLFLTSIIPTDIDFDPDPRYLSMITNLRATILKTKDDVSDLHERFQFPVNDP